MSDPSGKNPSESKLSTGQDRELSSDEADAFARQFKAIWDKSAKPDHSVAKSASENGERARGVGAASVPKPAFIPRPQDITPRGLGPVSSLPPPPVSSAPPPAQKPPASDAPQATAALAIKAPLPQAQPPEAPIPNLAALGITAPSRNPAASDNGKPTNPGSHPVFKQTLLGLTPVVLPVTPVESVTSAPPVQKEATSAPAPTLAREVQKSAPAVFPQPVLGAQEPARPLPSPFAAAKPAADSGLDDDSYPQASKVPKLAIAIAIAIAAALIVLGFLLFSGPAAPPKADSKPPTLGTEIGTSTPTTPVNTVSAPAAPRDAPAPSSNNDAPESEASPEPKEAPPQADPTRQPRVKERRPPVARSNKRPGETKAAIPKAPPPSKSPAIVRDNPF